MDIRVSQFDRGLGGGGGDGGVEWAGESGPCEMIFGGGNQFFFFWGGRGGGGGGGGGGIGM